MTSPDEDDSSSDDQKDVVPPVYPGHANELDYKIKTPKPGIFERFRNWFNKTFY